MDIEQIKSIISGSEETVRLYKISPNIKPLRIVKSLLLQTI